MSANQQHGQPLPPNNAWRAKIEEIDEALHELSTNTDHGAYIHAAHGAGKSTSLLVHAAGVIRTANPDARIIYILNSTIECSVSTRYMFDNPSDVLNPFKDVELNPTCHTPKFLAVSTYESFLDDMRQGNALDDRPTVFLADVPLRPTSEAEAFFSVLLEQVRRRAFVSYLFLGAHRSQFTVDSFSYVLKGNFKYIQVPDINQQPEKFLIFGRDGDEIIAREIQSMQQTNPGAVAIVGMQDTDFLTIRGLEPLMNLGHSEQNDVHITQLQHNCPGKLISIDSSSPSLPVPNVGLVITSGTYTMKIWDTTCCQLVTTTQMYSSHDLVREMSWVNKTGTVLEGAKVGMMLSQLQFQSLSTTGDPWSPAWNEVIMWTALTIASVTPTKRFRELRIRTIPDNFAVRETLMRLEAMQCIEDQGTGAFKVTSLGTTALGLRKYEPLNYHRRLNVHTAMLLARSSSQELSDDIRRVMIRLGVIMALGPENLCWVKPNVPLPSLDDIQSQCAGVGRQQAAKGHVWVALGVLLKVWHTGEIHSSTNIETDGWLVIRIDTAKKVLQIADGIDTMMSLPRLANKQLAEIEFTDQEIETVEFQLALCFMSTIMCVATESNEVYDAASSQDLVYSDREFLNVELMKRDQENRRLKVFFVIYMDLEVDSLAPGHEIRAKGLIYMPQRILKRIEEVRPIHWPAIIYNSYPFH